jgi:hypothetical protein
MAIVVTPIGARVDQLAIRGLRMFKMSKYPAVVVALVAGIGSANAGVLFTSVAFDTSPAPGETMVVDFDHPNAVGYSMTSSNAGLFQGPLVPGIAAPPVGDSTKYLAVFSGGSATLTAPGLLNSLSVYLGSIDSYNLITFQGEGGFSQSFNGNQLNTPADGDQFDASTNRRFFFNFDPNDLINQVTFSSSGNSFEFDNIAANDPSATVPEPVTLSLFGAGFAGIAAMRRRKKSKQV